MVHFAFPPFFNHASLYRVQRVNFLPVLPVLYTGLPTFTRGPIRRPIRQTLVDKYRATRAENHRENC